MRIILVLPATPRPFGDTAARWSYVLAKGLLERGHSVACFTVTEDAPEIVEKAREALARSAGAGQFSFRFFSPKPTLAPWRRKIRSLVRPYSETRYAAGLEEALASELRAGYDILHLEQLWTGWLGIGVPRTLLNVHHFEIIDLEMQPRHSLAERKDWIQMNRATRRILRAHRNFRVFTPRLLEKARTINRAGDYRVVPFALDLSNYPLQPAPDAPVLGLIGSMHWMPSRSAGERLITRIWPLVKQRVPQARLFIAGWNARKHLGRYLPLPDVTLEDSVPHPTDFFSKASVMVYAPSRGSGMKIKVMESMAYGVPVVTTAEGTEGLAAENGVHCWVAESDADIAARAAQLLEDAELRRRMRDAGRALIESRYSPAPVLAEMLQLYGELSQKS